MERVVGVEEARHQLGRIADEVNDGNGVVVLTRRGRPLAVLMSPQEYERATEARRETARAELRVRMEALRAAVATSGLDASVVDEAIAAARAAG